MPKLQIETPITQQPLTTLKGVGPALAEKLAKLSLHTVGHLLFHLPLRYQDISKSSRNESPSVFGIFGLNENAAENHVVFRIATEPMPDP